MKIALAFQFGPIELYAIGFAGTVGEFAIAGTVGEFAIAGATLGMVVLAARTFVF
jgi:hypothetical protein